MKFLRPASLVLAAFLLSSSSTPTQAQVAPSSGEPFKWVELPLPSGFTGSTVVRVLGTSGWFRTPTDVWVWSAIRLNWTAIPVSAGAIVLQYNDYITIEDGNTVHAFATTRGTVETLTLPSTPTVHHGPVSSNWVSIAVLGTDAWSFGAYDGQWRHHALAGSTVTTNITNTVALLSDGVDVYGVSGYFGEMVQAPSLPGGVLANGGDVGVVVGSTQIAGFSASTNSWDLEPMSGGSLVAIDRGYAIYREGPELVAFSGCTGQFVRYPAPASFTVQPGRYVAAIVAGNTVLAYGSGQNVFRSLSTSTTPTVLVDDEVLAVGTTSGVTAFSVVTGEFSRTVNGGFALTTNDAMVWADGGTTGWAYSAIRGTWVKSPVSLGGGVQVSVLRNGVVLSGVTSYVGFSGRSATWISQACTTPFVFSGPSSGDMFVAMDGTEYHAFDPVLSRWATTSVAGSPQMQDIWRRVYVAFDGTSALGYSLCNNVWSTLPIQGNFNTLDANSEAGYLLTSTHLYMYSGMGSLSTTSRFPEFSRLQPFGEPLRVFQVAEPGSRVMAIFSFAPAYRTVPGLGTVFIDTTRPVVRIDLGFVPSTGLLDAQVDLWHHHALFGRAVHVQSYVTPPPGGGPVWVSNSIAPVML